MMENQEIEQGNHALRDANQDLREGLSEALCRPDGRFGLFSPDGALREAREGAAPPINPQRAPVRDGGSPASLAEAMERGVLLVVASSGIGTGFLVDAEHLVTNHHVVDQDSMVLVVNKHLPAPLRATLVAKTPGEPRKGRQDLAVLKLEAPSAALRPFALSTAHARLEEVFAVGFPGFLIAEDQGLQALRDGDMSAAPEVISTVGNIARPAQMHEEASYILHNAEVAPGNSGGPLLDVCGRAIGVNTLVGAQDEARAFRTSLSIDSAQTAEFLRLHGVGFTLQEEACRPAPPPAPPEAQEAQP